MGTRECTGGCHGTNANQVGNTQLAKLYTSGIKLELLLPGRRLRFKCFLDIIFKNTSPGNNYQGENKERFVMDWLVYSTAKQILLDETITER